MEALEAMAAGQATKIIVPCELQGLAGTLAGLSEVVKPVTPGKPPAAPVVPEKKYHRPVEGNPSKCELGDQ